MANLLVAPGLVDKMKGLGTLEPLTSTALCVQVSGPSQPNYTKLRGNPDTKTKRFWYVPSTNIRHKIEEKVDQI